MLLPITNQSRDFHKTKREGISCGEQKKGDSAMCQKNIDYPETQKAINITYQGKSVRLDVYVEDNEDFFQHK